MVERRIIHIDFQNCNLVTFLTIFVLSDVITILHQEVLWQTFVHMNNSAESGNTYLEWSLRLVIFVTFKMSWKSYHLQKDVH